MLEPLKFVAVFETVMIAGAGGFSERNFVREGGARGMIRRSTRAAVSPADRSGSGPTEDRKVRQRPTNSYLRLRLRYSVSAKTNKIRFCV